VDRDFDPEWVERLGRACGTVFRSRGQNACTLARDARPSSASYREAMISGLRGAGVDVIDIGLAPSPLLYYSVKHFGLAAGAMITASHNPSEYNGFKIWSGESTLPPPDIQRLRRIMLAGTFARGAGSLIEKDVAPAYIAEIRRRVKPARSLKVVVDGGNGAGGEICAALLRALGAEVIALYCEPDGRFPHHHPDPVKAENMRDLVSLVRQSGADLGIGLDGDADRIGVVDETGRLLFGDELVALYAREILSRKPGAAIIVDVKSSDRLLTDIAAHGGKPEMYATGHSLMKARLLETGAALAGEMSGHMFFMDRWYGFDDAIYAAARLLELLAASAAPLSALPGWPATAITPEIQMPCPDAVKFAVVEKAAAYFRERYSVLEIDGVRLAFPDGWGLVRASNTQPVLVLRFEAADADRLAAIRRIVEEPLAAWIRELSGGAVSA
jgi:phosphomannomutase/phosphoglucomutase